MVQLFLPVLFCCVGLIATGRSDPIEIFSRDANEINQFREDDTGWTNINKEVDMALDMIWPIMVQKGFTRFNLPDMSESLSVKPLFITYTARLWLTNGLLYNIEGISRDGDAMMTYNNKSFRFRANFAIRNVEFTYDYELDLMGVRLSGSLDGAVTDITLSGDFSISVEDANIQLNNFQIESFDNIEIRLKYNSIIKRLSGSILRPITNLFRDRITTSISDTIRKQLENVIDDINENDRLHFKELGKVTLSGLTG